MVLWANMGCIKNSKQQITMIFMALTLTQIWEQRNPQKIKAY
ncbi:hypothetical protein A33Q_4233 [Indibacter alkaliphilus LW1]|uniref:Uncharacterized protein n=1 Tax=Indibacter alkaliphilus (strain CCUG 57479 / KCTC 22604 / LW1) TaxID=1189612 RepID=S2D512_INDAL|nr:hypothetical protein A33Q_4233 [Indibacter alkaliphilus LW1]